MAESDDEDGFGDFKFASSKVSIANDDDDDWGEFTDSRFRTPTGSLPAESSNISANGFSLTQAPDQDRVGPKPKGAMPLSFFGEEEIEEEGSGSFENSIFSAPKKVNDVKARAPDLNDLIPNLYRQSEKSKKGNGFMSGLTGSDVKSPAILEEKKANSIVNGQTWNLVGLNVSFNGSSNANFRSNGSDSFWGRFSLSSNALDASNEHSGMEAIDRKEGNLTANISSLAPNGSGSYQNGLASKGSESTLADGCGEVDEDDDDDGWEFKEAEFTSKHGGEIFEDEESKNQNESIFNFSFPNSSWTSSGSDVNGLKSNINGVIPKANGLCSSSGDKAEELSDDDGWEFKAAESGNTQGYDGTKVEEIKLENFKVAGNISGFSVNISPDLFSTSGQISGQPGELDFGLGLLPRYPIQNQPLDTENKLVSSLDDENIKPEKASSPLLSIYPQNESKNNGSRTNEGDYMEPKGALPLSIFGDESLETDVPLDYLDVSMHKATYTKPGLKDPSSSVSITDIISILYSQSEQSTINHAHNPIENGPIENGFGPGHTVVSNLVEDGDDFDSDSWEFKDAISESNSENKKVVLSYGDLQFQSSTKSKINDYQEFYSKLKAELCLITVSHLDNMKGYSGFDDNAEVNTLEKEIQDLYQEQYKHCKVSQENLCAEQQSNNVSIDICSRALQEEKFQVLEAEYHLSDQLSRVEKDVKSATELLKHAVSTLKILKLGSSEEQSNYVGTWYDILSACVRELKHGAFIWKQSLQMNISSQMLSMPQGKRYMIALGEIFRIVEILGCSVELYKPWIICSSSDSSRILALLKECSTLWSSSGIDDALKTVSDPAETEYDGTIKDLLQSIKDIHDLDAHELYDYVFSRKEPTCHLSGLPLEKMPGMKVVAWEGEDYFLKLANFWANLISHDPPNLPQIFAKS